MSGTSLMYWDEGHPKTQSNELEFSFTITAGKTITPTLVGRPVMVGFDAAAFASQAAIDSFLGTTNEFLLAAFDSTSLGTDAFAIIVRMGGQAAKLDYASITHIPANVEASYLAAGIAAGTLNSSSLTTKAAIGASGNLAARFVLTGLDALTDGLLVVKIKWVSK